MKLVKLVSVCLCLPALSGCVSLVSGTASTIAGGYSDFYIVEDPGTVPMYDSILFTPIQGMAGAKADASVVQSANQSISDELRNKQFRLNGEKPLYMDGFVIHADDGFMSKDVVVRIRLIDPRDWSVVREANVVGKAEGVNSLKEAARSIGRGVVKLLDKTPPMRNPDYYQGQATQSGARYTGAYIPPSGPVPSPIIDSWQNGDEQ